MELAIALYILTFLIPINGAFYLAARRERVRTRAIVLNYWKLRNKT